VRGSHTAAEESNSRHGHISVGHRQEANHSTETLTLTRASVEGWQLAQLSYDDVVPLQLGLLLRIDAHDVKVVARDLVALERLRAHPPCTFAALTRHARFHTHSLSFQDHGALPTPPTCEVKRCQPCTMLWEIFLSCVAKKVVMGKSKGASPALRYSYSSNRLKSARIMGEYCPLRCVAAPIAPPPASALLPGGAVDRCSCAAVCLKQVLAGYMQCVLALLLWLFVFSVGVEDSAAPPSTSHTDGGAEGWGHLRLSIGSGKDETLSAEKVKQRHGAQQQQEEGRRVAYHMGSLNTTSLTSHPLASSMNAASAMPRFTFHGRSATGMSGVVNAERKICPSRSAASSAPETDRGEAEAEGQPTGG
jgi:hypothetical protein